MKNMFFMFLIAISSIVLGQKAKMNINGQHVKHLNNKWYFVENDKPTFKVDTTIITLNLSDQVDPNIENRLDKGYFKLLRVNKLGFADIQVFPGVKWETAIDKLSKLGLSSEIVVNSLGETFLPNDPGFPYQYYLYNDNGLPDIGWHESFWYENGSTNPQVIAIIDVGVSFNNTDLLEYTYNWDYIYDDDTPDPTNNHEDHATGVAGIAAAITDNGAGVSGVAGGDSQSDGSPIMSLRVGETVYDYYFGWVTIIQAADVDDAIIFAADHGARVINMSFGIAENSAVNAAIWYAYSQKNCVLVAASGNNDKVNVGYPASNNYVIAVGGINKDYTPYGSTIGGIDLVAPSQYLYSLKPIISGTGTDWGFWGTGTSGAAPQVSGTAALLLSHNPSLLNIDVRKIMNQSTVQDQSGHLIYSQDDFGNGLLSTNQSLMVFETPIVATPSSIAISAPIGGHPTISWGQVTDADSYKIYRSNNVDGRYGFVEKADITSTSWTDNSITVVNPRFAAATYYYRVSAIDQGYESILSQEVYCGSNTLNKEGAEITENQMNYDILFENYPNPFNPSTNIKFSLQKDSHVKLVVINMLGQEVAELHNGPMTEGQHIINFNAPTDMASGVYLYALSIDNSKFITKKMLLLK